MIRVVHLGSGSCFLPIPDPGVKKTPDPGSATLKFYKKSQNKVKFLHKFCRFAMKMFAFSYGAFESYPVPEEMFLKYFAQA